MGADVPELFCVKSYRKPNQGSRLPVAIETPIGWSLLDPSLSPSYSTNCRVNFVRTSDDSIHKLVNCLDKAIFKKARPFSTHPIRKKTVMPIKQ